MRRVPASRTYGALLGLPLEVQPDLVDVGDLERITRRINGGVNRLPDREAYRRPVGVPARHRRGERAVGWEAHHIQRLTCVLPNVREFAPASVRRIRMLLDSPFAALLVEMAFRRLFPGG